MNGSGQYGFAANVIPPYLLGSLDVHILIFPTMIKVDDEYSDIIDFKSDLTDGYD